MVITVFANIVKILEYHLSILFPIAHVEVLTLCLPPARIHYYQSTCLQTLDSSRSYLLGVHRTFQFCHIIRFAYSAQENGLELVHSSICKEEGRVIVGYDRGGGNCKNHKLAICLTKNQRKKGRSHRFCKQCLSLRTPLRLPSLKVLQKAATPPPTNCMALPLEKLQELLPDQRSGPFRLSPCHRYDILFEASRCESRICGCASAQTPKPRFAFIEFCESNVTQSE
jgi:hypothetical protein